MVHVRLAALVLLFQFFGPFALSATKLHILLAMDTHAENLESSVELTRNNFRAVFDEIREGREGKVSYSVIQGTDLTPAAIRGFFRGNTFSSDTALLFLYAGHGATDDDGHYLDMQYGKIYREEIRRAMEETGTVLQVLITDCCSSFAGVDAPNRRIPAEWKMFEQLFFQGEGMVDITAAEKGTFGWFNNGIGGYFSYSFMRLLCEPTSTADLDNDGTVTWPEFGGVLKRYTEETFREARSNAGEGTKIFQYTNQTPAFFYLGGDQRDSEIKDRIDSYLTQHNQAYINSLQSQTAFQRTVQQPVTKRYALAVADRYEAFVTRYVELEKLQAKYAGSEIKRFGKMNQSRGQNSRFMQSYVDRYNSLHGSIEEMAVSARQKANTYKLFSTRLR